ncbi:MAG TPA: hypothetical protein VGR37_04770 [Longimicrobiaceae bacterium]|nr:hypothetical protein [Longimicrobiaceae bacterium]
MANNADRDDACCTAENRDWRGGGEDAGVGRKRPRAVAFVWGPEVSPAPSLPFGRWKTAVRVAA